ncbi:hypothetical protein, partial [Rhodopirellula bahusiensis]|uniref:hypothetical protein n=1 Tax=Rhodopirellula bahusiensis TaxID=2014065 RepID=UPI003296C721
VVQGQHQDGQRGDGMNIQSAPLYSLADLHRRRTSFASRDETSDRLGMFALGSWCDSRVPMWTTQSRTFCTLRLRG